MAVNDNAVVRVVEPRDAPDIATLFAQFEHPTDAARLPERIQRYSASRHRVALVAARENAVVGIATAYLYETLHAEGPAAMLSALVVGEAVRGQGVGRTLVDAVGVWARANGAERLVVTTANRRAGAHAFYERLGFEHTGRRYQKRYGPA